MATRRQFLTATAAAVSATVLPGAAAVVAAGTAPEAESAAAEALELRRQMKRYATMAARAQAGPAPEA
jgi:hypothetical protein